ncbi:Cell division-associated, ATP-dependent zinc metalloprotease FtsH [Candidatus Syntrophocurvum alkaliphilum]|uniref:ATP-dependent zinc metalloprotease FtsH n=1 Tax=Candidatus Syntrophocurvum alkaliphilum TaxID=2293317 RepID=A0A6I6DD01_9FIRM|nr:ATP-dependent zinc metalloprotease FtsH [Candidatus Syntrophocurvum alkaliphilum]QGU00515.1 Cell division-associated, ATP-dependent zinc metalloprotease FtsH [Candidatus Syntrophocurvum alkaliphilum]
MDRALKNIAIYVLIVLLALFAIRMTSEPRQEITEMNYPQLVSNIEQGQISEAHLLIGEQVYTVTGTLRNGDNFEAIVPKESALVAKLHDKKVPFESEQEPPPPWWMTLLTTMFPILILIAFLLFIMNQTQGGGNRVMQFGKTKAKMLTGEDVDITFDDVAGVEEAKEEMAEVVEFLKSPQKFIKIGAKIPKGVLLFGSPGTGKTLMAKAVAGEAGVPFFSISGSDFVEMFVGVGASRVRDLFEQAKKNAPCIVYIDEIDAVGRQRGAGYGGGHDEREQTLNQLLVEMDGFETNEGIIVMASTNRPDILDKALLRPGRFDRHILIDNPDVKGREAILKVHAREKPLADEVSLSIVAKRTPGFTGADLANMVNEAALLAARRGKPKIGQTELEESIERVIAGPEKKTRVISEKEKRLVAYHEAGHAIVSYFLPYSDKVHKISIIPRGRAGGYTLLLPEEDRNYITKSHLLDEICTLLGGRVAEALVLNDISTGAQNDLERTTGIVRKMITEYGMSDELGPLTFGQKSDEVFLGRDIAQNKNYSDAIAYAIDKEASNIVDNCYNKAEQILKDSMDKLHQVAEGLMELETVEADEFDAIMKGETDIKEIITKRQERQEAQEAEIKRYQEEEERRLKEEEEARQRELEEQRRKEEEEGNIEPNKKDNKD